MQDRLSELYEDFLHMKLPYQKDIGHLHLEKLHIITGTTWAGKSSLIQRKKLPSLISYKTGPESISLRPGQQYLSLEKFTEKLENGDFFDVYKLDDVYYWFALSDYYEVIREHGIVYIDLSLENLWRGITYTYGELTILTPSPEQLSQNLQTRARERNYTEEKKLEAKNRQAAELLMLEPIMQKYSNHRVISSIDQF